MLILKFLWRDTTCPCQTDPGSFLWLCLPVDHMHLTFSSKSCQDAVCAKLGYMHSYLRTISVDYSLKIVPHAYVNIHVQLAIFSDISVM